MLQKEWDKTEEEKRLIDMVAKYGVDQGKKKIQQWDQDLANTGRDAKGDTESEWNNLKTGFRYDRDMTSCLELQIYLITRCLRDDI